MRRRFRFARTPAGAAGLVVVGLTTGIALFGPFFAPHSPVTTLGAPASDPSGGALLGTDFLGRDVLSRVLCGGRSVLLFAVLATVLAYAFGLLIGLVAGYSRSLLEPFLMRSVDVMRAFPKLLFFMIIVTGLGTSKPVLISGIALVQVPGIARLVHTATRQVSVRGYVEAAVVRGERTVAILRRDILPNVLSPLVADGGLRFTLSILLVAGVNFLGLGLRPPDADWSLMIGENREITSLNPWAIFVPAALIALLTVGVNLVGDAVVRSLGRSANRA